jgi:predicted O-methyltransferase YrrM
LLSALEKQATKEEIPIVGPVVGELLSILLLAIRADRALELGTSIGYSAIQMGRACQAINAHLTTVEQDPALARRAMDNIETAQLSPCITVKHGSAADILTALRSGFDFIFLDIEKTDYAGVLPQCKRLLRPGGLLVADNTAFEDARPFNRQIYEDPDWRLVNLYAFLPAHSPENDGLCLALKGTDSI